MAEIVSIPEHGEQIVQTNGQATASFQIYLDDISQRLNDNLLGDQVQLASYTVAELPDASTASGLIYVSDESGGAVPAFSDGTDWRRVTDRTVVS